MAGRVQTRRWNDPAGEREGTRLLVTRYRPRGVRKEDETWDEWHPTLGPSQALHAAAYGKGQVAIGPDEYARRYLGEMIEPHAAYFVVALKDRVARGEDVVLLCSSACIDPATCHRTLLRELVLGGELALGSHLDDGGVFVPALAVAVGALPPEHERTEAVPLRLEQERTLGRDLVREPGEHRRKRWPGRGGRHRLT